MKFNREVQRKIIAKITASISGEELPIKFTKVKSSSVYFVYNPCIDRKVTASYLTLNILDDESENLIPYLPIEVQNNIKNYSIKLFVILHEIGHLKTFDYKNQVESKKKYEYYSKFCKNQEETNILYRSLKNERLADEWAYKWIVENPSLAKQYSELINNNFDFSIKKITPVLIET